MFAQPTVSLSFPHHFFMGSQESSLDAFIDWATMKAFKDVAYNTNFRHLTLHEKQQIDLTICRTLETNRRIETKLLKEGLENEQILDALRW